MAWENGNSVPEVSCLVFAGEIGLWGMHTKCSANTGIMTQNVTICACSFDRQQLKLAVRSGYTDSYA